MTIYRPGSQQTSTSFFDEFVKLLERLASFSAPVIITGDVNIHLELAADSDTLKFTELLTSFGLSQYIDSPTHELGDTLDIIVAPCGPATERHGC